MFHPSFLALGLSKELSSHCTSSLNLGLLTQFLIPEYAFLCC